MIELMWFIYFIELLGSIKRAVVTLLVIAFSITVCSPIIFYALEECTGMTKNEITEKIFKSNIKKYITVICVLFALILTIPNERTMYIMAGLYAGNEIVDTLATNETVQKAEKLINKKLDELLQKEP